MPHRAFLGRLLFCAVFSLSLLNIFTTVTSASFFHRQGVNYASALHRHAEPEPICPHSELADHVLVVLRTGATESLEKVPIHLHTTLRCVPHFTIFSDMDEEIEGHTVHDVLQNVSEDIKLNHDDFKLYNHLQTHGRSGLPSQPPITSLSGSSKGDYLQTEKPGWALDKWKFLPMMERALEEKPNATWFVFIEPDTYLSFHNLLTYLSTFSPSKEYYIGKHLFIDNIAFAYGGAGFALSAPAMRTLASHHRAHASTYESFTQSHWVGDCALGKLAQDTNITLHRAFPHFQSDAPATLDPATEKLNRPLWCYPPITYHHVSPTDIANLWSWEQTWHRRNRAKGAQIVLRHRDVFAAFARDTVAPHVPMWDNLAADAHEFNAHDHSSSPDAHEREAWKSFAHCRALCEARRRCVQFSYTAGSCGVSDVFRLGAAAQGPERVASGWILERVEGLFGALEERCGVRDWFAPDEQEGEEDDEKDGEPSRTERRMRRKRRV